MPVNSTHAEYESGAAQWSRARDVLAGEDAVKAAGERYLPRLDSQSNWNKRPTGRERASLTRHRGDFAGRADESGGGGADWNRRKQRQRRSKPDWRTRLKGEASECGAGRGGAGGEEG